MIGNLALPSLTLACRCSVEALLVKHSGGCLSPASFSASRHADYRFVCLVGLASVPNEPTPSTVSHWGKIKTSAARTFARIFFGEPSEVGYLS